MQRRDFVKTSFAASAGFLVVPSLGRVAALAPPETDELARAFADPPALARPGGFWQWMNGNVTREGITLDLEAMRQMGLGSAYSFNNGVGIPRGPIDYASPAWLDLLEHAAREAERLGLQLSLHNAPGYSGTGGPWITPADSMQQLVWSEALATSTGRRPLALALRRPQAKLGYYRDACVLAYPALAVETAPMWARVRQLTLDGQPVDTAILRDPDTEKVIRLVPAAGQPARLVVEFAQPYAARALTLHRQPEAPLDPYDGPRDYPPTFQLEASDDGVTYRAVATVPTPALRAMDVPATQSFAAVTARFFRLSTSTPTYLADLTLHQGPRLPAWPAKTGYGDYADALRTTDALPAELLIDPATVVDVSRYLGADGTLRWPAPAGRWVLVRLGHTTTGEEVAAAPDAGRGLECDKYRQAALDVHFEALWVPVLARLQPYVGKSLLGLHTDSWEAGKQNWTRDFPAEFNRRQGYDPTPYLLALTGRVVGSVDTTERFLADVRRTFADLLAENYYAHYRTLCHANGLRLSGEPYGDGNFETLQVARQLDAPLGEFWTRYTYGSLDYLRLAASAGHLYGSAVVGAEAFTGEPRTSRFTDYPYSLKSEGDWMLTLGVNRFLLHVLAHQPHPTAQPGMSMGPFGTHFGRNATWAQQMYGWTSYLTRAQYLLQQGRFVADVCYYRGEGIAPKLPGAAILRPALPLGYAADIAGPDALLDIRLGVRDGRLVVPDGPAYRVLVLPAGGSLSVATLRRVRELVLAGLVVLVGEPPATVPGLGAVQRGDEAELRQLVADLWGSLDGPAPTVRSLGQGQVVRGVTLDQLLPQVGVLPDFAYSAARGDTSVAYLHRVVGETDVYFVANRHRRVEELVGTFRVTGRQPELWDAETGRVTVPDVFAEEGGRTRLPLRLEPAGSVFVVFRRPAAGAGGVALQRDGQLVLGTAAFAAPVAAPFPDVQNDFSILLWVKPDIIALPGRGLLFYPPAGAIYGPGHAACGLAAGLNGVRVVERTDRLKDVLTVAQPLVGWTHLALVYEASTPTVYLNGQAAGRGTPAAGPVHPGLHAPPTPEQFTAFFEGDSTAPQLVRAALTARQVQAACQQGLPDPLVLPAAELRRSGTGEELRLLAWQPGRYELLPALGQRPRRVRVRPLPAPQLLPGPWQVSFQSAGSEAGQPQPLVLPALASLHLHPDFDVRHFAGTATYAATFGLPAPTAGQRRYLDLGRVAVLAEATLNGQALGQVWKPPFRFDITDAARPGPNALVVRVTTLWPNRLIGDEQLPAEAEYEPWGAIRALPAWYRLGQPKPGPRTTFSTWRFYTKEAPLLTAGLLGPVRVLTATEHVL